MSVEAVLELRGVTKSYGAKRVVEELSLTVERGEVVALLGPSGCGKTTILHLAAGVVQPDCGSIVRPSRIGYVFQEPRLIPWRTALDNVLFVAGRSRHERETHRPRAEELLEAFGLTDAMHTYPRALSGGMRQRVAIARMLVRAPELILLDEPLSALDGARKDELQEVFAELLDARETGALYVTHDPHEARRLADRLILLDGPRERRVTSIVTPRALRARGHHIPGIGELVHVAVS